jgi:hypothetical protein
MNKPILFFDNESSNWTSNMDKHSEFIDFVFVDDIEPNRLISDIAEGIPKKPNTTYSTKLNMAYISYFEGIGNKYAFYLDDALKSKNVKLIKKCKEDIPSNGANNILESITSTTKYILLDWDRTVTAIEGMFFDEGLIELVRRGSIPLLDVIYYIMGGEERTSYIQHMFKEVIERLNQNRNRNEYDIKIPIFILTNNPNASNKHSNENRWLYIEIIKYIFEINDEDAENMLYSSADYGFKKKTSVCNTELVSLLISSCDGEPRMSKFISKSSSASKALSSVDLLAKGKKSKKRKGRKKNRKSRKSKG